MRGLDMNNLEDDNVNRYRTRKSYPKFSISDTINVLFQFMIVSPYHSLQKP
jgi:hypothetical protein